MNHIKRAEVDIVSNDELRYTNNQARVAELVDARDLKSLDQKSCGFDSRLAHHAIAPTEKVGVILFLRACHIEF